MKSSTITGRVLGLALALIGLMGWYASVDYAFSPSDASASGPKMTPADEGAWRNLGPNVDIRSLAIDPTNPNIIYVGSRFGVFKTVDGGESWSAAGLGNLSVEALAVDFVNPNTVFAGTYAGGNCFQTPLFKSTDGGETWSNQSTLVDCDISMIVMDPTSPNTLYAGSEVQYVFTGGIILWKSVDGGAGWGGDRTGNIGLAHYGWVINPANPQTLYAPGDVYDGFPPNVIYSGLFKSTDGGATWSATGLTGKDRFVSAVSIDPRNPDTLYAGTLDYEPGYRAFREMLKSTDGGVSWFAINSGLTGLIDTTSSISALAIQADNPSTVYAGTFGAGVFLSKNGGASWNEFNVGLTNLGVKALVIDPSGRHLYAATSTGVFGCQFAAPCADPLSPANQSFDSSGGTGFVNVTAASECSWTAASNANWISVTSDRGGSGSGTVSYSVAPNESTATAPRIGIIGIAARFLTVTQAGAPVRINSATVSGKKLLVTGENFDVGAVILLNGEEQKTRNDDQNPKTIVIGKKAGKTIKIGDRLQVRNPNGTISGRFTFAGM